MRRMLCTFSILLATIGLAVGRRAPTPCRASSPSRSGRSRSRATGSSARSRASRSDPTTGSGSCTGRSRCSTTKRARPRTRRNTNAARRRRPVMEFDADGNLHRHWGGPGQGYEWPQNEHGIFVDKDGNVWVAGNGENDQILKFTADGKFLLQIGKAGDTAGSQSTTRLGRPAHMVVDEAAERTLRRRRLQEPPHHRVRRQDRRLQAALGCLRQGAERRQAAALQARRAARRSSSPIRCTACGCRTTGWSMSATAPTTASRCSARTAPS